MRKLAILMVILILFVVACARPAEAPPISPLAVISAITVADQTATDKVRVSSATIDKDGWVQIHAEKSSGGFDPNSNMGNLFIKPGNYSNLEVTLAQDLSRSQIIYVMLHYDNPADGRYTFTSGKPDDPAVIVEGRIVVKPVAVTVGSTGATSGNTSETGSYGY